MNSLIVDTREDGVLAFMNYEGVVREQITVGDFAIKVADRVVAIFERKTLDDYGASIRDGRMANKLKMVEARETSEAAGHPLHLYYIIERPLKNFADTHEFGGVAYSSIRSSIRHLMTEYGIMIIWTTSEQDTARELYEMYCSYQVRPTKTVATTTVAGQYELTSHDLLHKRHELTLQDKKIQVLMSLPGVGKDTAVKLSVRPIAHYIVHPELLPNVKVRAGFQSLTEPTWNYYQERFLGGVPGIGKKTTSMIRATHASMPAYVGYLRAKTPAQRNVHETVFMEMLTK